MKARTAALLLGLAVTAAGVVGLAWLLERIAGRAMEQFSAAMGNVARSTATAIGHGVAASYSDPDLAGHDGHDNRRPVIPALWTHRDDDVPINYAIDPTEELLPSPGRPKVTVVAPGEGLIPEADVPMNGTGA